MYICTPSEEGAKYAELDYKVMESKGKYSLVEVRLHTGRTHQIRVHAKHMGHPVAGDPVYGFKKQKVSVEGQLLHAWQLQLTHPTSGERMTFQAPLPQEFQEILQKLCVKYQVDKTQLPDVL